MVTIASWVPLWTWDNAEKEFIIDMVSRTPIMMLYKSVQMKRRQP